MTSHPGLFRPASNFGPTEKCKCGNPRYASQDHCIICSRFAGSNTVLAFAAVKEKGKRKLLLFQGRRTVKIVELFYQNYDWQSVEEGGGVTDLVTTHQTTHTEDIKDIFVQRVFDEGWQAMGWDIREHLRPVQS